MIEKEGGMEYIYAIFSYVCGRGKIRDQKLFERIVEKGFSSETGRKIMTLAEIYENQGIKKGIERGRIECARNFAAKLLRDGQSERKIMEWTGLTKEELERLEEN